MRPLATIGTFRKHRERRGLPRRPWNAYRSRRWDGTSPNYCFTAVPLRPQILLRVPNIERINVSTLVWVSVIMDPNIARAGRAIMGRGARGQQVHWA